MGRELVGRLADKQKPRRKAGHYGRKRHDKRRSESIPEAQDKRQHEIIEDRIEFLVDKARRFIDNTQTGAYKVALGLLED